MKASIWDIPGVNERMRELHSAGKSFGEIAALLSNEFGVMVTRFACIGRAHRLELPDRPQPIRERWVKPEPVNFPQTELVCESKDLMELGRHDCRWPIAELFDRPPYRFCGRAIWKVSWCKEHYKKVYHPARERWA